MKWEYVVCHHGEIGIKGKNRGVFEKKLKENIKRGLRRKAPDCFQSVKRISGRIIIKLKKEQDLKKITAVLKNIFGISYFALAINSQQDLDSLATNCFALLKTKDFKTFKIATKRAKKDFPLTSQEVNEKVGAFIRNRLNKKVDLKNPQVTCFIEIVENFAFLYLEKIKGQGGLPVGISGKAIALLSGGIDSPVAAFYGLKRGARILFVHFHSYPYTEKASIEKAKEIVEILNDFQSKTKLYLVPFAEIQKEILVKTPARLRVVLYRRFMLRIAQKIAQKERALAIITGESIGQVASQTLENIKTIEEVTKLPVLRPLIGWDKEEIVQKAKEIGTYKISILPHQDCCARFLPRYPATKTQLKEVKMAEKNLNTKELIKKTIRRVSFVCYT